MKKLICFDLDGTLTPFSTWEAFNARLGISPEDDYRLFSQYKEGTLDYKAWIIELVRLYKEHGVVTKKDIEDTAHDIAVRPEAEAAIQDAKDKGYEVIMISGAIDAMAMPLAATLKIGAWLATNKAVFNDSDELIDIEDSGHEREAKLLLLKEFCLKNRYELSDVITVADGGNDTELFQWTKGVVLGDNKELKPLAWKQINSLSELRDII